MNPAPFALPLHVVEGHHRLYIHESFTHSDGTIVPAGGPLEHLEMWEPKTGAKRGCSPRWLGFTDKQRARAEYIVRAVNCHEELVQLLNRICPNEYTFNSGVDPREIRAAITRAIGK
jgi:hypothetical protein